MTVQQIYELTNTVTKEVLGDTVVVNEDLSNIVDLGAAVFNANQNDNYINTLVDRIGRTIVTNRQYKMTGLKGVIRTGWEFGSVLQKITSTDLLEAQENESWNLQNGVEYSPNVFKGMTNVSVKYFNSKTTLEVDISIVDTQLKEAFLNAQAMNAFIEFIYNEIDKTLTVKTEEMVMRTVNTLVAETLYTEYPTADYSASSGVRAINLLKLYNDAYGTNLTKQKALLTPEFIRFATQQIGLVSSRLTRISKLFNIGKTPKFTPKDMQRLAVLTDFKQAVTSYLQSDTFHKELVALPDFAEDIPYLQGTGTSYALADISKINVKTPLNHTVECDYIIGFLYDMDSVAVANLNERVTSEYNAKAEFTNNFFKVDCSYLADTNENFIVFFLA